MSHGYDAIPKSTTDKQLSDNKNKLAGSINVLKNVEGSTIDEQLSKDQIQKKIKQDNHQNINQKYSIQQSQVKNQKQIINHQHEINDINSQIQQLLQTQIQQPVNDQNQEKPERIKLQQTQRKENNQVDKQNDNLQFNPTSQLSIDYNMISLDEVNLNQNQKKVEFKQWVEDDETSQFKQSIQIFQIQSLSESETINNKPIFHQGNNNENFLTELNDNIYHYDDASLSMYSAGFKKSRKKKKNAIQSTENNYFNINASQSLQPNELRKLLKIQNSTIKENLSRILLEVSMIQETPNIRGSYTQNGEKIHQRFHSYFHIASQLNLSLIINQPIVYNQSWKDDHEELKQIFDTLFSNNQEEDSSFIQQSIIQMSFLHFSNHSLLNQNQQNQQNITNELTQNLLLQLLYPPDNSNIQSDECQKVQSKINEQYAFQFLNYELERIKAQIQYQNEIIENSSHLRQDTQGCNDQSMELINFNSIIDQHSLLSISLSEVSFISNLSWTDDSISELNNSSMLEVISFMSIASSQIPESQQSFPDPDISQQWQLQPYALWTQGLSNLYHSQIQQSLDNSINSHQYSQSMNQSNANLHQPNYYQQQLQQQNIQDQNQLHSQFNDNNEQISRQSDNEQNRQLQ